METSSKEIEISTIGLDDFVLENSLSNFIEIILMAENSNQQQILFSEEKNVFSIKFQLDSLQTEEAVFRKFITKRLLRAHAIVKIPKGKNVTIFGENINVASKEFLGNVSIFIEKGDLKFEKIQSNTDINFYAGTISANVKNMNIMLHSNNGNIKVDDVFFQKDYQKKVTNSDQKLSINTIKGIIFLKTQ
ncbi:MAG: hypothetical protein GW772_10645 [Flavobacteriia bacterium]|nr:hypothetical protein [Flavobacteriia bacterium]NCT61045.1 hypothetical protein [Flavobacteriia bacterium]